MTKKRKRRREGEGTIIARKDGSFLGQISAGTDQEGKRRRYSFTGKTAEEVIDKMARAKYEMRTGIHIEPTTLSVGKWLKIWVDVYAKPNVRPATYDLYRLMIDNHLAPGLGDIPLQKLQASEIQAFYNQKAKEYSTSTVRHMHVVLSQAMDQARKEHKLMASPVTATRPPRVTRPEAKYFTSSQIDQLMKSIEGDRWHTMILFTLGTGMRRGEVCALKWENVDLEKGIVYVKESARRVRNHTRRGPKTKIIISPPKTDKGKRAVPLPSQILAALKKHKAKQAEEKLKIGEYYKDQGFVFAWEDGRIVDPDYLTKYFRKVIKKCGFEGISLHSLRHSYASALLKMGESPKTVQEILGHSTIMITLDTYSHIAPEMKEQAAQKMDEFLTKKKPSSHKEG